MEEQARDALARRVEAEGRGAGDRLVEVPREDDDIEEGEQAANEAALTREYDEGERDGVLRFPASKANMDAYPKTLPGLRGSHILPGAGHWVQQERPAEVNKLLIAFLRSLSS